MVVKMRGPMRSMIQPSSGMTQVSKTMNSVKPHWISESLQPVAWRMGSTNSVQAYCRLAIMIIATSEAESWSQRFFTCCRIRRATECAAVSAAVLRKVRAQRMRRSQMVAPKAERVGNGARQAHAPLGTPCDQFAG